MHWQVYILLCSDGSLYTGISTDVKRRVAQHTAGTGAKYFRGRFPCRIVYLESGHNRSSASRREMTIKKMGLTEKQSLLRSVDNQLEAVFPNQNSLCLRYDR
jgi:putative endonuclease